MRVKTRLPDYGLHSTAPVSGAKHALQGYPPNSIKKRESFVLLALAETPHNYQRCIALREEWEDEEEEAELEAEAEAEVEEESEQEQTQAEQEVPLLESRSRISAPSNSDLGE